MLTRATTEDLELLIELGSTTFRQAHEHGVDANDLSSYLKEKFTEENMKKELENPLTVFHTLKQNNNAIGYSKIVLNTPPVQRPEEENCCKLERIYLLNECHGKGFGKQMFDNIVNVARQNNQESLWLTVWVENEKGIRFYEKTGFRTIGEVMFKLGNAYNPNFVMWYDL